MSTDTVSVVTLDRDAARAAISAATAGIAALIRDIDDIECRAACTEWTVAETAAHVVVVLTGFSATIAAQPLALEYVDADFPTRLAACNTTTIDVIDRTDAAGLADQIVVGAQHFLEVVGAADGDRECETPWYGPGRTRSVDCLTALALGELVLHGRDIALGTGRRWPISTEVSSLIVNTVCPAMSPLVIRPDAGRRRVTYEIRLRGGGVRFAIEIADGNATVREAGGPVDCVISADPVTFLLVMYGRMPVWRALVSGGIGAMGRRPWLGLRYKGLFFNP